ncbi:hypothetical protein [Dictyobacter arantiisoli]|uniref:Uncharacterized protein n=1 Tax=Dictyobacter arantiisoli TaxID=2014874 RepID=A0A5A5TKG1_9CHLR|nr:hypothetical protein [Dictyobacter arantiisoli]GCF11762.1 hypothetical protein KDI_53260 [Dictyobacter arantiisoli]
MISLVEGAAQVAPLVHGLIVAQIVFILIVLISAIVAIYADLKVLRKRRASGLPGHWYTRPTLLFCVGVTLAMVAIFIDSATTTHFFPNNSFWNLLDILLLLLVLLSILSGFIFAFRNSRKKDK